MKNAKFAILAAALAVGACTTAQTDKLVGYLGNFNRGVVAVDESIATISASLYKNCNTIHSIGQAASDITGKCAKASPVVDGVNDIINGYCHASQVTDVGTALAATADTISSAKSQLSAAKKSCGT